MPTQPSVSTRSVTLLRGGNWVVVDPTTPEVHDLLVKELIYLETKFLQGGEKVKALRAGQSHVVVTPLQLYATDHKDRISCPYGFAGRIRRVLRAKGYTVTTRNLDLEDEVERQRRAKVTTPDWSRVENLAITFRYRQDEGIAKVISAFARAEPGRVDCPTGWGKSKTIAIIARLLPWANILVLVRSVPVLRTRLYPELVLNGVGPQAGILCAKEKVPNKRVMCVSFGSLHRVLDRNWDLVLVDEAHQAASDDAAGKLVQLPGQPVILGLSASWESRLDGKDIREEAIFGDYLMKISYQEAVDHGLVVPIEVSWRKVVQDLDLSEIVSDTEKKRRAIWQNDFRNAMVLEDSMQEGEQTMIFCETIEHLLALNKLDPSLPVLFAAKSLPWKRYCKLREYGLPVQVYDAMTQEKLDTLTRQAMSGKLKRFAVNTIFNVGVDMPDLIHLVRADGMSSPTADTQIPGRTSRITEQKIVGVIHDYIDKFDKGCLGKSMTRAKDYAKHRWVQHLPDAATAEKVRAMYLRE